MIIFSNCKINLGLNIISRRTDGFHNIESLFYPVDFLYDVIEIIRTENNKDNYYFSGDKIDSNIENNLCFRAVELLRKHYKFPSIDFLLHKVIPSGAGLGGGSSNATNTIILLNKMFDLKISDIEVEKLSLLLGSDCPFFVYKTPKIVKGRGEIIENANILLNNKFLLIIKPNIHISTAMAYSKINIQDKKNNVETILNYDFKEWKNFLENDFEKSVFSEFPEIKLIKDELYKNGALYAQMSGSGAACYGIFSQKPNLDFINNKYQFYFGYL